MSDPVEIRYCPSCGSDSFRAKNEKHHVCTACDFQYFHNTAGAVAGIIYCGNEILLSKRAHDPGKGSWDLPGGFVDFREEAESALKRELREELAIEIPPPQYCCSSTNEYFYAGILYHSLDLFFKIAFPQKPEISPADDVCGYAWFHRDEIPFDSIAFPSIRTGLSRFIESGQS